MLTLTLDTSTHRGTIALSYKGHVVEEVTWNKSSSHSEQIVLEIQNLYIRAQVDISKTELIICGVGPGSFTGLRVALSFARTLASGLNIPIIPVENCWAIALNAPLSTHPITVILDAQKNMFFMGTYLWEKDFLTTVQDVRLVNEAELQSLIADCSVVISNVDALKTNNKFSISTLEPYPSAKRIHDQVVQHREKHQQIQWDKLEPLYLRASAAEEVFLKKNL